MSRWIWLVGRGRRGVRKGGTTGSKSNHILQRRWILVFWGELSVSQLVTDYLPASLELLLMTIYFLVI